MWVTLIGFLVMIKPVREAIPLFMLQFNGLDRPEVGGRCKGAGRKIASFSSRFAST